MRQLRIVFLGAERVGKTSIIKQFLYGSFQEVTESTLGNSYNETICLPNGLFQQVQIIDTSGSNEFPAMRDVSIRNGDYFVVMYAVDNPQSFDQAHTLVQKVKDIKGKDFSRIILVGNKIDKTSARQVTTEEVLKKSVTEEMLCFTETSAKLNCNIRCLFQIILRNYVKSDDLYFKKKNRKISKCKVKSITGSCFKAKKTSVQNLVYSLYTKNKYLHVCPA
ncbi:GTP-binding protein Di-Ras1-like [Saccostrea echinata]|uniref:GTP-binding protein Di-Ras1-like n=1 Tax=Saccostrea echinata TaxID=191078 RepID=UPI002A81445B|nr:GTP-binding protein Di-Ras1-like [Saccostrea echinata]